MNNSIDMTEGKPLPLILRFSAPMLLVNVLQLLYTIADSAVVGRMLGVDAFAAVGATASLHWLIISIVLAVTQGFGIIIAQRFGAKEMNRFRQDFVIAFYLSLFIGVVIGFIGLFGADFLLHSLNTPTELMPGAVTYIKWLVGGIAVTFAYNLLSATLRAIGDSKTPMVAIAASSLLNIVLDIALAGLFGIAGVAAATLFSQVAATIYCFIVLQKTGILKNCDIKIRADSITSHTPTASHTSAVSHTPASSHTSAVSHTPSASHISPVSFTAPASHTPASSHTSAVSYTPVTSAVALLRLGLPLGFRNGAIEVGGLVAQWYINGYGAAFVAGVSAAKRMYSLLLVAGGAFDAANATFVAQNFGAGKLERVRQGVACSRRLMLISSVVIMAFTLPLRRFMLSLLLEGEPALVGAVLDVGARQLMLLTLGLPLLYLLFLYRSTLEGMGRPLFPVLSGFTELASRIICVILLTPAIGEMGVLLSDPSGWIAAAALLITAYYVIYRCNI